MTGRSIHRSIAAMLILMLSAGSASAQWRSATERPQVVSKAQGTASAIPENSPRAGAPVVLKGMSASATEAAPEIKAMARALKYNVVDIYEYVRNEIEHVPTYGLKNGALGCLLAGRGNDWDQAALLIALLRESGYSADFARALIVYDNDDLQDWIGVDTTEAAISVLSKGGYSTEYHDAGKTRVWRTWAEFWGGSSWLVLDPAFKPRQDISGIDLVSACGYSYSDFMGAATNGATVTTDYALSVNETAIRNKLTAYTTNLLQHIQQNAPNSYIENIVGASPLTPGSFTTGWPYAQSWYPATYTWFSEPAETDNLRMTIRHRGIDETLMGYEIAAKRVTLFYDENDGYKPLLTVDGETVATGSATTLGSTNDMTILIDHPYMGDTLVEGSNTLQLVCGGKYLVIHDFESSSRAVTKSHNEALRKALAAGAAETSEAVAGGGMQITLDAGLQQWRKSLDLFAQLSDIRAYSEHFVGIMGQGQNGYYVDLPLFLLSHTSKTNSLSDENAYFKAATFFVSGLEHGTLEQSQGPARVCASTIKLLQLNNSRTNRTYLADSNNWDTVESALSGYTGTELSAMEDAVDAGHVLLLPKDHDITLLEWSGIGYVDSYTTTTSTVPSVLGMKIGGGYDGGHAADDAWDFQTSWGQQNVGDAYIPFFDPNVIVTASDEPVDLQTGNYFLDKMDLSLSGGEPRGLNLTRHYNSGQSGAKGPLGYGWTHGYDISVREASHGITGLGDRQAKDAAPNIVQALVIHDLLQGEPNVAEWVAGILTTKWGVDQLIETAAIVRKGSQSLQYTKMPDGSYIPPPGETATLTKQGSQFVLEERFGTRLTFNSDGLISSWADADSNTLSFAYNASTNLQTVTDCYSRSLTFSYQNGLVSSVSDSTGRSVTYDYTDDNLVTYTDPDGHEWTYGYGDTNNAHLLTVLYDPEDQMTATNTYNALGQVDAQINGFGNEWKFYVTGARGIEENPQGGLTINIFDDYGRNTAVEDPLHNITYTLYDGQGHVIITLDPNLNGTTHQYDGHHNRTNTVDALGHDWAYQYDAAHHLVAATDPLGNTTHYGYDVSHHLTNTVDALGHATRIDYYASGAHKGLPNTVTAPNGNVTTYTYNSYGSAYTIARTDGGTVTNTWNERGDLLVARDANGNPATMTYNNRRLPITIADAQANTVSNAYNAAGLKTTVTDPLGRETVTTWTPTYKVASVTYPDNSVVSNRYDSRDWLIAVVDARGNTTSNVFDIAGRKIAVVDRLGNATRFALDPVGNVTAQTNTLGDVTTFVYDDLNRLIQTTDPLTHSVSNTFDAAGRLVAVTDETGYKTEYTYDAANRRTQVTKADGSTERFEFDSNGNLVTFHNGLGKTRTFAYDGMNRVTNEVDAVGNSRGFVFDAVGNLLERHDADGAVIEYAYDDLNRLAEIAYPNTTAVHYAYNELGLRTYQSNTVAEVRYGYDEMNRLSVVTQSVGAVQSVIEYAFDSNGNRTNIVYPGSVAVGYSFDAADRLTHVADWASRTTVYSYDDLHRKTGVDYSSSATGTWTWDDASRLTRVQYHNGASNFIDRVYTLDAHGNVTAMEINAGLLPTVSPAVKRLSQNAADELTAIQTKANPGVQNWTEKTPAHDEEGNLTTDGDNTYGYDYDNRLVSASAASESATYYYAGDGSRVAAVTVASGTTNTTIFVLDHADPLRRPLAELDGSGALIRRVIWGRGVVAQVEANGTVHYFHPDGQGSTLALSDTNSVATDQFFYSPYGEVMARTGSTDTPYQWVGGHGVRLASAELYFMKARYYHSDLRRFTSADPLGVQELLSRSGMGNLYQYGNNSPLVYVDPDGEWVHIAIGAAIGGIGGGIGGWIKSDGDWRSAGAGFLGGAAAGAFVASGAGIVAGALGAGTISAGGAVASMGVIGASGGVMGNTAIQVMDNGISGQSFSESLANVDPSQQLISGTIGAGTGLLGGGAIAGMHALNAQAAGINQVLSQNITTYSQLGYQSGASQATVNQIQNALVSGMYQNSFNAANVGAAVGAANAGIAGIGEFASDSGLVNLPGSRRVKQW